MWGEYWTAGAVCKWGELWQVQLQFINNAIAAQRLKYKQCWTRVKLRGFMDWFITKTSLSSTAEGLCRRRQSNPHSWDKKRTKVSNTFQICQIALIISVLLTYFNKMDWGKSCRIWTRSCSPVYFQNKIIALLNEALQVIIFPYNNLKMPTYDTTPSELW